MVGSEPRLLQRATAESPQPGYQVYRPWSVMPQPAVDFILDIKIN